MELLHALESTTSTEQSDLEAAQRFLDQAALSDFPLLLKQLSEILQHGGNSQVARMQAGLQLKNLVYSKDPNVRMQHQQRWLQVDEKDRLYIKQNCLGTLGTEPMRPSQAAQVISGVACAELPMNVWPDLITILTQNVINNSTEMMREATLETIGYICQDIDPMILTNEANNILTAIVYGMKKEEPSDSVKLAATNAMLNSLEFTKANFDKDCERHFIMQVVCEATQSPNTHIKVAALQCLVKIMSLYYQYMETYMGPALFAISVEAMKSDVDEVALQGIEFWSNVCDEEVDLVIESSEAAEQGRPPERVSKFYAKGALQFLIPILTHTLAKQEENDDDDEWNPCKAAGVCMMLLANCCENSIVPHVMPFIREKIVDPNNWQLRDAAVMALGCILEGPDQTLFMEYMPELVPAVVNLLQDQSIVVRDTAAWTIGRMCEILPDYIINEQFLVPLLEGLLKGLQTVPRVAANVCWAFSSLAEAAYEAAEVREEDSEPATYCLSAFYDNIVKQLLDTTDRHDGNQQNLRSAAYEALMELVKNSPKDCYQSVQQTTMIILQRLEKVLMMEAQIHSSTDRAVYNDLQSLLCATLQSVLRKVSPEDAPKISDPIMAAILRMFSNSTGSSGGVQEDALLAVSTLVEILGDGFMKYMEAFKPFLMIGLKNYAEYQVCLAAVGLVGDICRAVTVKILPACDDIMQVLLEILQDGKVHRSVKPQILSVFGDIALAIGPEFIKYLELVLNTLYQASKAQVDINDPDMVDYLNDLREGCLEAYTGIVQGLKGENAQPNMDVGLLGAHVPHMIAFIEDISNDSIKSDSNVSACCGLIGDLCTTFSVPLGPSLLVSFEKEKIQQLLTQGRRSKVAKTKMLATWASKELRKLKNLQS